MDGNYHGFGPDTGYPPSSYYMTGTELNGKLYVIGGANGGSTVLDKVIQYDPVTDKITSLKKLPKPICQAGIVSYQDKLYILGGSLTPSGAPTNDFFSYSIAPG